MRELADRFEKKTGATIDIIYGSSGDFAHKSKTVHCLTFFYRPMSFIPNSW